MKSMKFRLIGSGIHLLVSLAVAGLAAAIVFLLWFPGELSSILRGGQLFVLVVSCDVVLGPLLSLVICNPEKSRRSLVIDYAVIGCVQLAALLYGLHVVEASRPAYLVFATDRFEVATSGAVQQEAVDRAGLQAFPMSLFDFRLVALQLPTDARGHNEALMMELAGQDLTALPRYFAPYDANRVAAAAKPLAELIGRHPDAAPALRAVVARGHQAEANVRWLPLKTPYGFHTVLLTQDAQVIGFAQPDPY